MILSKSDGNPSRKEHLITNGAQVVTCPSKADPTIHVKIQTRRQVKMLRKTYIIEQIISKLR